MRELTSSIMEVERELSVRRVVYPRLVLQGKLTQEEADRRMHAMRMTLYYLGTFAKAEHEPQPITGE